MAPNIKHIDNEHRPGLFFLFKGGQNTIAELKPRVYQLR